MAEKLENKLKNIPIDITQVPNANVIPYDLYKPLIAYRNWADESQNSDVLIS